MSIDRDDDAGLETGGLEDVADDMVYYRCKYQYKVTLEVIERKNAMYT